MNETMPATGFKPKKSVALSGVPAGNTALCTVGRTGNDLHYRGYDILDIADKCEFEEVAYLLIHGKLPNAAELAGYKEKLKRLRGLRAVVAEYSLRWAFILDDWRKVREGRLTLREFLTSRVLVKRLLGWLDARRRA